MTSAHRHAQVVPNSQPPSTSLGQCTPNATRDMPTRVVSSTATIRMNMRVSGFFSTRISSTAMVR